MRYVIKFEIDIDEDEFDPSEVHCRATEVAHEMGYHLGCELSDYDRGHTVSSQTRADYIKERKMLFVGRPEERD